jgi:excisionase family DNA binding protein
MVMPDVLIDLRWLWQRHLQRCQLDLCMTRNQYKQWLLQQLAEVEATIERPATEHEANIVFEAKKHAYFLGLYELASTMPERDLKTPLDCCLRLRECVDYVESPPPAAYDEDTLIDLKEAARLIGYSEDRTRRLAKKGDITYVQNGRGRIKFRRESIDEYIVTKSVGPTDIDRSPAQRRPMPIVFEPRESFNLSNFQSNS